METLKLTQASAASITAYSPKYGYWNFETGTDRTRGNVFWMADVSKLVTASIIFQLIEEKQLLLSDSVSKWFPTLPFANVITIDHLLTHTSGLPSLAQLSDTGLPLGSISNDQLASRIAGVGFDFCPGTNWNYSDTAYWMLSSIASSLDGTAWQQIVHQRISKPLGIKSLTVPFNSDNTDIVLPTTGDRSGFLSEISATGGAGALMSTTADSIKLLAHYLRGDIVNSAVLPAAGQLLFPLYTDVMGYGRGIMVTRVPDPNAPTVWVGHAGGSPKGKVLLIFDTNRQTFLSLALNSQAQAEAIANTMLKIIDQYERTQKEN